MESTLGRLKKIWHKHWPLLSVLVIFFLSAAYFVHYYIYQINPDAVSYFAIAQKYTHFDIRHAVNGYWGPLISWLLVPFIWLHLNLIVGAKLINTLASAGILVFTYLMLRRVGLKSSKLQALFLLGLAATFLSWAMTGPITPDILLVLVLLGEILVFNTWLAKRTWPVSLALAACGALLYFAKAFGFYLFIGQLLLVLALEAYAQKRWRLNVKSAIKVLVFFLLIASPFIAALSVKYHQLTISTTGTYNLDMQAPKWVSPEPVNIVKIGPIAPPNPSAYYASEDPGLVPEAHWSPLDSGRNFKYFLGLVGANVQSIRDDIINFGALTALGCVMLIAMLFTYCRRAPDLITIAGASVLWLMVGYSLVLVEARYLWAVVPLAFTGVAAFLVAQVKNLKVPLIYVTGALLVLAVVWTSATSLFNNKYENRDIYQYSTATAGKLPSGSRFVSNNPKLSLYTAYYGGLHSYGIIKPSGSSARNSALYKELKKLGVDYYVDYLNAKAPRYTDSFLTKYATYIATTTTRSEYTLYTVTVYHLN